MKDFTNKDLFLVGLSNSLVFAFIFLVSLPRVYSDSTFWFIWALVGCIANVGMAYEYWKALKKA